MEKLPSVGKFHLIPHQTFAQQMSANTRRPMAPTLPYEMKRIRQAPWQLE
jgi:hypothetical protein